MARWPVFCQKRVAHAQNRMNNHSKQGSAPTAWTLSILAVPMLYFLGVGVTFYGMGRDRLANLPHQMERYCEPFFYLQGNTPLSAPLQVFSQWWFNKGFAVSRMP